MVLFVVVLVFFLLYKSLLISHDERKAYAKTGSTKTGVFLPLNIISHVKDVMTNLGLFINLLMLLDIVSWIWMTQCFVFLMVAILLLLFICLSVVVSTHCIHCFSLQVDRANCKEIQFYIYIIYRFN